MTTKLFELRDKNTFIPILCIDCTSKDQYEIWLLRRAGFGETRCIQLVSFSRKESHYDPYEWGDRTYAVAHDYITKNWDTLDYGQVICVEYILGERDSPKKSERFE